MVDAVEIRLRIVEAFIAQAARADLQDPQKIINVSDQLSNFVLKLSTPSVKTVAGETPSQPVPRKRGRPRKG